MDTLREEPAAYHAPPPKRELWSHEFLDALSLAKHQAVAAKLRADRKLVDVAQSNAQRWLVSGNYDTGEAQSVSEWLPLLQPDRFAELLETLTSPSENATRMRQSSPFTDIVSKAEYRMLREQLIKEWSAHAT